MIGEKFVTKPRLLLNFCFKKRSKEKRMFHYKKHKGMRRLTLTLAFSFAAAMMMTISPVAEARDSAPRPGSRSTSVQSRPAARPTTGQTTRPGGSAPRPGTTTRPGNPGAPKPPATGPSRPTRPGGPAVAPGGPGRPGSGQVMRPPVMQPAPRPYRPVPPTHYARPVPPHAWRPVAGCPTVSGILGITFGTGINLSLDYLYGGGYTIAGYTNNAVYLTDINAFNYIWPDATLYYGSSGLTYSQFFYSTQYYDLSRYNAILASLTAQYGRPVSVVQQAGGGYVSTWFGYNNSYITLSFGQGSAVGGGLRFFTTLTFGN